LFYNYYKLLFLFINNWTWIRIRICMIEIFSGTDMIKIWNWFKAIGSFVRKIKQKNTSADLSFWGANLSNWGAELSGSRFVLVPKCLTQVPICPGAEVSRIHCNMTKQNIKISPLSMQINIYTAIPGTRQRMFIDILNPVCTNDKWLHIFTYNSI
jgi:hypothetical protein